MKTVVLGVLIEDGRVLLGQRKRGGDYPWQWGCPGGKVEEDESPVGALAREWSKELGVDVSVGVFVSESRLPTSSGEILLQHYRVYLDDPMCRPTALVEEGIGWFTVDEIRRLSIVPSLDDATLSVISRTIDRMACDQAFLARRRP